MPKPNEDQVVINKLVLDKVLLSVDAQGYVDLLDPVRVRSLVGMLPEGVKYWLLGADGECPKLCEADHWGPDEESAPPPEPKPEPKPRATRRAKTEEAKPSKLADTNRRLREQSDAEAATTDEDVAAVLELLSGDLIGIDQMRACLGWPDDEAGYTRAGNALCHLRDVGKAESVDHDDPAKGGLKFRGGTGRRFRCGYDGKLVEIDDGSQEPVAEEPLFAPEADVLGAMLDSKPQTVAQIASFLQLGVARVAPAVDALVAAGKVERATGRGRYPMFQKAVAA